MRKPDRIPIANYDYHLPDDRIAKYPLSDRGDSKLLLYDSGKIESHNFDQAPGLLMNGDQLYFNVTRVVQARLIFRKETGGKIEIFILEPFQPADHQLAFSSTRPVEFICLIGNAKKWKHGELQLKIGKTILQAEFNGRMEDKFLVRFSWNNPVLSFGEILEKAGSTPIPPYLSREAEKNDAITYQTVYARENGSVAAPTAGLHFTKKLLKEIDRMGVQRHDLTLHVGAGTFIPVKEENAANHTMHAEYVTVKRELLEALLSGKRTIAVGTTSTRTLESLYWLGARAQMDPEFTFEDLFLDQWDAYLLDDHLSKAESADILLKKMHESDLDELSFRTRIMITPGYEFKVIDGLFTNFHQPKSTLLLLIAALVGDDWKKIYDFAMQKDFRFLSYGDSSLLFRTK